MAKSKNIGPQRYSAEDEKTIKAAAEKKDRKVNTWIAMCAIKESKKAMGKKDAK